MRAGRIGRTAGRAAVIALFGLAVTAAGVVGVHASEAEEYTWDSVSTSSSGADSGAWGSILEQAVVTAHEYTWD